ncbi:MAG TPA: chemotaxis protein CheB [Terriglobales bacterium]|nr:chemotaxis protein CheB [Terriglobales bacterium]
MTAKRSNHYKERKKKDSRAASNGPGALDKESGAPARCVVVGVGASAGGLEAITELLKPLPADPGMAFVLVPHLDPTHESAMTELLARATKMPVKQVEEGDLVKPNHVYIIPPNEIMTIQQGALRLKKRDTLAGIPMPIDIFLRSLAEDRGKDAIGVILSGTATDGTLGLAVVKNEGGITFAQEPKSARHASMPNSAIASGHVDFVLPPREIARELIRLSSHPYVAGPDSEEIQESIQQPQGTQMEQIFRLLRQLRKVDFTNYKPATIRRRIHRRMALAKIDDLGEYVSLLRTSRQELEALHSDLLINVTSFFRDPETFEALAEVAYPALLRGRQPNETIRIWVPGCSTGEEAYSHAISLLEYATKVRADITVQIFGTDLSESAIRTARMGIFKPSIAGDLSPARLRRFFNKVKAGYQISKSVRDLCIFATQNVFDDPPFSHMDLVSCRNVLIYLGPELQKRVIPVFHYALNPSGFLMVGNTEALGGIGTDLFEPADKRHKIYLKKLVATPAIFGTPTERFDYVKTNEAGSIPSSGAQPDPARTPIDLQREADRLLLTRYVPAAVVVNPQYEVVQIRGNANRYLELPSGKATLNLLKMAKSGLLSELQNALEEARVSTTSSRKYNVQFDNGNGFENVNIEVIPFHAPLQSQRSFVVVFEEVDGRRQTESPPAAAVPEDAKDRQVAQLKQELAATKDYLQSIIEALEASNEELQSANEEIQSGNEELQSTNEELQTSKEELESANEELNTVNEEMQDRNLQLTQANNDLLNLLASVNIGIVMLDSDFSIRRMTPQVEDILGITSADMNRPIRNLRLNFNVDDIESVMLDVTKDLQPREVIVQNGKNHRYQMRMTPYRTSDNRIEGVVLVFLDISNVKRATTLISGKSNSKTRKRKTPRKRS